MESSRWLFNHHAFLEQQCKNFVKLHEKQLLQNAADIQRIAKCVNEVNDRNIPLSMEVCEKHLTQLQARVLVCQQMCERVLARRCETKAQSVKAAEPEQSLVKSLEERARMINDEFDKKEKDLKDTYAHMRESLKA